MATKKKSSRGGSRAKNSGTKRRVTRKASTTKTKVRRVMHEYKEGKLHSGSKKGPIVKSKKQAIAIALSEAGVSRPPVRKKS